MDGLRSPFRFEDVIREAVHSLKYRNIRALAQELALFMAEALEDGAFAPDLLVPVPLHPKRLRERGYNQSELLARSLAKLMRTTVAADALSKVRDTLPQAKTANVEERRVNVSGAFACVPGSVQDKRVLLVDDVTTTGATLESCAQELKRSGAESVWGLTVAREL
ncbi:MAG: ComF family protein [Dehalococcoidia bacterium]